MTTRIVCGVDFSEASEAALAQALVLAKALGGQLHLVHVFGLGAEEGGLSSANELAREAHARLGALQDAHPGLPLVPHVVSGEPAEEVLRVADEVEANYIVAGTHGRTGWRHLILGSVAERIVKGAKVPVVTVPRPER